MATYSVIVAGARVAIYVSRSQDQARASARRDARERSRQLGAAHVVEGEAVDAPPVATYRAGEPV